MHFHLVLNVSETQEMLLDPRNVSEHQAQVGSYKYLGVHIDDTVTLKALILFVPDNECSGLDVSFFCWCLSIITQIQLTCKNASGIV